MPVDARRFGRPTAAACGGGAPILAQLPGVPSLGQQGGGAWPYTFRKAADVADFATREYWATNYRDQFFKLRPFLADLGADAKAQDRLLNRIDAAAQTAVLRLCVYLIAPDLDGVFPPVEGRAPVDPYAVHCRALKALGAIACPTPPPEAQ